MEPQTIKIEGVPATFATSREKEWKVNLVADIPHPSMNGDEYGITMQFLLPTLAPQQQPLDVDNLAEPVFAILIGQLGWFGRSRPRIQWWSATKTIGIPHGCVLTINSELVPILPTAIPAYDELYTGVLPKSAMSPELSAWASGIVSQRTHLAPSTWTLYLGFGSPSVNIGDISTGVVKSFIDCLYPFFGGNQGRPEDYRIAHLIVQKAVPNLRQDTVRIILWYHDNDVAKGVYSTNSSKATYEKVSTTINPCRPGTAKWIVCEAALKQKTYADTKIELDRLKPGSGERLKVYVSDIRSENNLDIRIEDVRMVCYGTLRK